MLLHAAAKNPRFDDPEASMMPAQDYVDQRRRFATSALVTSVMQPGFQTDHQLIRFGQGATHDRLTHPAMAGKPQYSAMTFSSAQLAPKPDR